MDALDLARLQFAVTTNLHFVFVALTLGLVPMIATSLVVLTVVLGSLAVTTFVLICRSATRTHPRLKRESMSVLWLVIFLTALVSCVLLEGAIIGGPVPALPGPDHRGPTPDHVPGRP